MSHNAATKHKCLRISVKSGFIDLVGKFGRYRPRRCKICEELAVMELQIWAALLKISRGAYAPSLGDILFHLFVSYARVKDLYYRIIVTFPPFCMILLQPIEIAQNRNNGGSFFYYRQFFQSFTESCKLSSRKVRFSGAINNTACVPPK